MSAAVPSWDYTPVEPFAAGSNVYGNMAVNRSLDDALRFFAANFLPTEQTERASAWITDTNLAIVLGWLVVPGQAVLWYGCAAAYRAFALHHDPFEVACFELVASGVVPRLEDEFNGSH
jgi:hypothetical protein